MAQKTLEELLKSCSMHLNGDTSLPEGDELTLWKRAINAAQDSWADLDFDWDSLKKLSSVTLPTSGASVALPTDYVKLDGFTMVGGVEYSEIRPEEINLHSSDKYVIPNLNGRYLTVYPVQETNVTVDIRYVGRPTDLSSLTDISACPSDSYLINKAVSIIFTQRDNSKYSKFEADAEADLLKAMNKQNVKLDQFDGTIKNRIVRNGFSLGVN